MRQSNTFEILPAMPQTREPETDVLVGAHQQQVISRIQPGTELHSPSSSSANQEVLSHTMIMERKAWRHGSSRSPRGSGSRASTSHSRPHSRTSRAEEFSAAERRIIIAGEQVAQMEAELEQKEAELQAQQLAQQTTWALLQQRVAKGEAATAGIQIRRRPRHLLSQAAVCHLPRRQHVSRPSRL